MNNKKLVKVFPILNHYCHRTCYFVLPIDYNSRTKSLEQIYNDSIEASFVKEVAVKFAIRYNIQLRQSENTDK